MKQAKKVALNTGILYCRMFLTVFISLYTTRLTLKGLGQSDFGIFNVVAGVISMLVFLNSAMTTATQRFMSYAHGMRDEKKINKIFNVSLLLHFIIGVVVLIFLEILGKYLFNNVLRIEISRIIAAKYIYQFMIFSTFCTIVSVPFDSVINSRENMLIFAILSIIEVILRLLIAILLLNSSGDRLIFYGGGSVIVSVLLFVTRVFYCKKYYTESNIEIALMKDKSLLIDLGQFASWTFLGSFTSMLANYGQTIVVNIFFGVVVNAAAAIAGQLSAQLGTFSSTMLKALNPVIDKSEGAGDRNKMLSATFTGSKFAFFLLLFLYVPFFIEMPTILELWLKRVPMYTIVFCRLQLIRSLVDQLIITLTSAIVAVGKIRYYQIYSSILALFPLSITYIMFKFSFPVYTMYYIFIGYSVANFFLILYTAKNNCSLSIISYLKEVVFKCFLVLILMSTISILPSFFLEKNKNIISISLTFILSSITFIIAGWKIGFSIKEKQTIKNIILSMKSFKFIGQLQTKKTYHN